MPTSTPSGSATEPLNRLSKLCGLPSFARCSDVGTDIDNWSVPGPSQQLLQFAYPDATNIEAGMATGLLLDVAVGQRLLQFGDS